MPPSRAPLRFLLDAGTEGTFARESSLRGLWRSGGPRRALLVQGTVSGTATVLWLLVLGTEDDLDDTQAIALPMLLALAGVAVAAHAGWTQAGTPATGLRLWRVAMQLFALLGVALVLLVPAILLEPVLVDAIAPLGSTLLGLLLAGTLLPLALLFVAVAVLGFEALPGQHLLERLALGVALLAALVLAAGAVLAFPDDGPGGGQARGLGALVELVRVLVGAGAESAAGVWLARGATVVLVAAVLVFVRAARQERRAMRAG